MAQDKKDGKLIYFGEAAITPLVEGMEAMYAAVTTTYGPKGKNVLIEKTYGRPVLTRDGVTVAKEVHFEQRRKNMGAGLIKEASETTNRVAGDGTTASVAITYTLILEGLRKIANGADSMEVKNEILEDSYKLLDHIDELSKPVADGQLEQVATVSSGDPALGKLIAEAVETVGPNGGIITEKAVITGVDRAYVNGYFMQQGFSAIERGKKTVENPYMVISSKIISSGMDVITLLNKIGEQAHIDQQIPLDAPLQEPLRISFFGEFEGDAYNTIVANLQKGGFDGTITKTPPMGDMGVQYLEDLAIYTGGKLISAGDNLTTVDASYFGRAEKVSCTNTETTVFGGAYIAEDLEKRKAELKERLESEEIDAIAEKLRDRLAKLENKIALFRIGGATDTEKEEKEYRIEDAIQASRGAAAHGVVAGAGTTLIELSKHATSAIWQNALKNTYKRLLANASLPVEVKLAEIEASAYPHGYNLRKDATLVDIIQEGILDPTLVLKQVIENSASTAANAVTIGAVITAIDKKD